MNKLSRLQFNKDEIHKIFVFSDSHGSKKNINKIIPDIEENYDLAIFLGDGEFDLRYMPSSIIRQKLISVKGNHDIFSSSPDAQLLAINDNKILITHGHKFLVKSGLEFIVKTAIENEADLCLFGHTHNQLYIEKTVENKKVIFANPGSLGWHIPHKNKSGYYAEININDNDIQVNQKSL